MKTNKELCQELTNLLGFKTYTKIGSRCTGKWRGTIDYSLLFDDKTPFFISNGMHHFNEQVQAYIDFIKLFNANKKIYLNQIIAQSRIDNITAENENLYPIIIKDVDIWLKTGQNFLWPYILIEVNGIEFKHIETGLKYAIWKNNLVEHFNRHNEAHIYTAGAIQHPTFVFSNVRFSHLEKLYKII